MDERIRRSRRQERRGAGIFGGTVNAGSGNGARKNDVRTPTESIEFKSTKAASYSLKLADLGAAWVHALNDNRRMLFGIEFASRDRGIVPTRYIVMTEDDYLELRGDDGTAA
jgi:hypothetical protein